MASEVLFFGRSGCELTKLALRYFDILGCSVTSVLSKRRGEQIDDDLMWWKGDYIFAFRSHLILPEALTKRAEVCAVNFHPGSTEYPGTGCANFALYEQSKEFGVTAHVIEKRVDSGAIIATKRFSIHNNDTVSSLLERTHIHLLALFYDVVDVLVYEGQAGVQRLLTENENSRWSTTKRTVKELDALQVLTGNEDITETRRIIRATHTETFPTELVFHGEKFVRKD